MPVPLILLVQHLPSWCCGQKIFSLSLCYSVTKKSSDQRERVPYQCSRREKSGECPFARLRVWITFVDKKTANFRNISITFRSKTEKNRKKRSKSQHPILPKLPSRKKTLPILPILTQILRDSVPPPLNFLLKIAQKSSQPFINQHLNNPKQLSPNKIGTVPNKADSGPFYHTDCPP